MKHKNNEQSINIISSYFIGGVIIFVVLNLLLLQTKPLAKVDPESLPSAHTWVWWASKEYLAHKTAPQVVFLGSSLLMHPISRLDANFTGQNIDYVHHHYSAYMQNKLKNKLHEDINCFNFALPGGMMSDDYMVVRALFNDNHKPQIVILGLSLRDFIDNGVTCAVVTPPFRYLKRYVDTNDIVDLAVPMTQVLKRFDYLLENSLYLWNTKLDLQVIFSELIKKNISPLCAQLFPASRLNEADPGRNLPSNLRSEIEEGMFIVPANQPYSYQDNSIEYKKRYKTSNESLFVVQEKFLEKLLELAEKRQIKIILVNMPLTEKNHSLMPAGAYKKYTDFISQACNKWGVPFIDLDASGKFDNQDYSDTLHLNASGGKKLVDIVTDNVVNEKIAHTLNKTY